MIERRDRIAIEIGVPDAEDLITLSPQECVARLIMCDRPILRVLAAVEFDDQHRLLAQEVREIGADRDLAFEFEAAEPAVADARPESSLGIGLVGAEAASEIDRGMRHKGPLTQNRYAVLTSPKGEVKDPASPSGEAEIALCDFG